MVKDNSISARIITAFVIIIPILVVLLFAPRWVAIVLLFTVSFLAFAEWLSLSNKAKTSKNLFILLFVFIHLVVSIYSVFIYPVPFVLMIGIIFWIVILIQLLVLQGKFSKRFCFDNLWLGLILTVTFSLSSMYILNYGLLSTNSKFTDLQNISTIIFLFLLLNTALFDSAAFFIGRRFGKRKFFSQISPNKTIEGLFGGVFISLLFCLSLNFFYESFFLTSFLIFSTSIFAITGDYFISFLKRKNNIKDTGSILPGHGGILDRIDSHLAVIPLSIFLDFLYTTLGSYL